MIKHLLRLIYPPKCIMCKKLLERGQEDICPECLKNLPSFKTGKKKISFIAGWTAVWYYKDNVRQSLVRFKFHGRRSYATTYGKYLAARLQEDGFTDFDVLTWIPVSAKRRRKRGYDQVELLAQALGASLQTTPMATLHKHRHNAAQSTQRDAASRRANVLGAYRVLDCAAVKDKRILLLDDIVTTGATASECARTLLVAGAKEVKFAAVAATDHK